MKNRFALNAGILLFSLAVLGLTFLYGPWRRSFVPTPRVVLASSAGDIERLWEKNRVRGRIALYFTRYLNAERGPDSSEVKFTELAMNHGLVRTVYHVVPDSAWPQVRENLAKWPVVRSTRAGLVAIFEDGRVHVLPLSQFAPIQEQTLVVVEPGVWTGDELKQIARLADGGGFTPDLLVVIRGSDEDVKSFGAVKPFSGRGGSPRLPSRKMTGKEGSMSCLPCNGYKAA